MASAARRICDGAWVANAVLDPAQCTELARIAECLPFPARADPAPLRPLRCASARALPSYATDAHCCLGGAKRAATGVPAKPSRREPPAHRARAPRVPPRSRSGERCEALPRGTPRPLLAGDTGRRVPAPDAVLELAESLLGGEDDSPLFVEFTGLLTWGEGAFIDWHRDDGRGYLRCGGCTPLQRAAALLRSCSLHSSARAGRDM